MQGQGNVKVIDISKTDTLTELQKEEVLQAKLMKQEYDEDATVYGYDKLATMLEKTKKRITPVQARLGKKKEIES